MLVLAALLGLAIGVAVNALADSLPVARRLRLPACPACGAARPGRVWSGLAAWTVGPRRCPACGAERGWRAPAVEIAAAAGFAWLAWRDPRPGAFGPALVVVSFFLLFLVIDLEHRLILHAVSLPAMLVIGLLGVFDPSRGPVKTLAGGAAGLALFFGLYLFGEVFARVLARLRRRPLDEVAFGFGDVMLAGVIGLTVGWPGVVLALLAGVLAAGAFSLVYVLVMVLRGRYSAFTPIPYGPFMILGAALVYFGGGALQHWLAP